MYLIFVNYDILIQVSSVPSQSSIGGSNLIPCLGLVWSNMVNVRIQVRKTNKYHGISELNIREFQVIFSSSISDDDILEYVIESKGVKVVNR